MNTEAITAHVTQARRSTRLKWLCISVLALVVTCLLSLSIGARPIDWNTLVKTFQGHHLGLDSTILWQGRLPRTLNGLFVGMALGVCGALIQALTRNPLADPGILGVNSGASLAVAIAIVFLGATSMPQFFFYASLGAFCTSVLVFILGRSRAGRPDPLKLTLAGVAIGAVLSGISSGLTLFNPAAFDIIRFWVAGSLDIRNLDIPIFIAPLVLIGCAAAFALTPSLNVLSLGEALASSLGIRMLYAQLIGLAIITLLCGAATAAAGPIGFVSLMMPHVARWMVGPDQRWIVPFCCVLTPILLLWADMIGRIILTSELRVSVVTAFIGAPILIYLVRQKKASSL